MSMFKSELEKDIWIAVYTRFEPGGKKERDRMRDGYALVMELRESLDKLLAFGAWTRAAAEILGERAAEPGGSDSVFRSEIERRIWVSAFARWTQEKQSAEQRAKRAWEFVLEFRKLPKPDESDQWEQAVSELAR